MSAVTSHVFRLPDLGEGLTEAELVSWLVSVGDVIAIDQAIAEVETAKSTVELPSPFAGTILALHGEPGHPILVGAPVLEVAAEGLLSAPGAPVAPVDLSTDAHEATELDAYRAEERAGSGSGNVLIGYGTSGHAGAARTRPRRGKVSGGASQGDPSPQSVAVMAPREPATTQPAPSAPLPGARTAVRSPIVRRLARDLGVDVTTLVATGADGAVTRDDVLRAAQPSTEPAAVAPASPASTGAVPDGLTETSRERMSMLRRAVSAKLSRSRSEIPEATVWVDVDVTDLWNLRPQMATEGQRAPSFTAILARYVLLALADFPLLAGRIEGEEIVQFDGVNLGIAADTERGLLVPIIPRAHEHSLSALDDALRALATEARSGGLAPERLSGSTFTLNNYGAFGVDGSAAIINHPEVAILGVGQVRERAWVVGGELAVRRIAQLSLVFDHRVCDGGYAAGFLRRIVEALESPLTVYGRI